LKAFFLIYGPAGRGVALVGKLARAEVPLLENPHEGLARFAEEVFFLFVVEQKVFIIESEKVEELRLLPDCVCP